MIIALLATALSQNADDNTLINCSAYRQFTIDQSWTTVSLGNVDIIIIEVLGSLAQIGLLFVLATFIFIPESREPPGEIFALLSFFNFLGLSSQMASSIFVQKHQSFATAPPSWNTFCFGAGIINIIGSIGVNIYNILFCVYVWLSIKNTLKPNEQSFLPYHIFCLAGIGLTALFFYLTDNVGVSANGICSYKMNPVTPFVFFSFFLFYIFIAINTLRSFKKYVPNIKILRLHRRQFIVFFNLYLTVNSILTATSSVLIIIFEEICQAEGVFSPGVLGTFINIIEILQGIIVVFVRLRHPLIKSHVAKLFNSILHRPTPPDSDIHSLKECIRLYNIYNYLSAARIAYRLAPVLKSSHVPCHYTLRLDNDTMRSVLGVNSIYDDFRMPDLKVTFYCCVFFKESSRGLDDPYDSIAIESNKTALRICSTTDGGKSGEFFFVSEDKKFILKTIKKEEVEVFLRRANSFIAYFSERNPNSLILRYTAMYSISYYGVDCDVSLILMANLKRFPGMQVLRTYDLKGSKYKRQVLKEYDELLLSTRTLKDTDFANYERKIVLKKQLLAGVQRTLTMDVDFLASLGLMDYSLLVIKATGARPPEVGSLFSVVDSASEPHLFYIIGIIDYLQVWNLKKIGELQAKKLLIGAQDVEVEDISAQEPIFYRDRFKANVIDFLFSAGQQE